MSKRVLGPDPYDIDNGSPPSPLVLVPFALAVALAVALVAWVL